MDGDPQGVEIVKDHLPHVLLALSLCLLQTPEAGALTLFRLGGEGLPNSLS